MFGGILYASALNDYYDHTLLGERNEIGALLSDGRLNRSGIAILTWSPWLASLVLFLCLVSLKATSLSLCLLWASFILSYLYCAPPFRLKERGLLGVTAPPVGIFLLFVQGLALTRLPDQRAWMMAGMVFVFTWYLDFLHLADDSTRGDEVVKIPGRRSVTLARLTAAGGLAAACVLSLWNLILLISAVAWTLRLLALRNATPESVAAGRKNILSPIYRVDEFAVYTAIVVFDLL